jgi:hypothetical protein
MSLPDKLPVADLHFDTRNPRLVEFGIKPNTSESEILQILWDAMDVMELVLSISSSGYFPHEPLIVTEEDGKHVVLEGNRRLAALKVLLGHEVAKEYKWKVPDLTPDTLAGIQEVPVIFESREDSWKYLGFKHVNGPAKWTSFAKAKYIAQVHREYEIPLADIARQIGDGHKTVQRLYRGLMVLEQAEDEAGYNPENSYARRIFFSHLYTALDKPGFTDYLGLAAKEDENPKPVAQDKLEELRQVCVWLFGDKEAEEPPVIKSQAPDLKRLDAVLRNREALYALKAGEELANAFELTRPTGAVLEEALLGAKRELMKAKSFISTGYDKSESMLRTAGSVADLADSIYEEMDRMRSGARKSSRLSD